MADSSADDEKRPKKRKRSELEKKDSYLQEIKDLEKQIGRLEGEIETEEIVYAGQINHDTLKEICAQVEQTSTSKSSRTDKAKLKARVEQEKEIEKLMQTVEKLGTLTGIVFTEDRAVMLSPSNENNNQRKNSNNNNSEHISRTWRRKISGLCEGIEFNVEFDVKETEFDSETVDPASHGLKDIPDIQIKAAVYQLAINLPNTIASNELKNFISKTEQEGALQTFFSALQGYSQWYNHRLRTFQHFKSKYPNNVLVSSELEGSRTLSIVSSVEGLHYIIHWVIDVNFSGIASPAIDAIVCSSSCQSLDDRDVTTIQSVPKYFRTMLLSVGIEQAIELVIKLAIS